MTDLPVEGGGAGTAAANTLRRFSRKSCSADIMRSMAEFAHDLEVIDVQDHDYILRVADKARFPSGMSRVRDHGMDDRFCGPRTGGSARCRAVVRRLTTAKMSTRGWMRGL
jgi:hypothetical protein